MGSVTATSDEIQNKIKEIVTRNNAKVTGLNSLPELVRAQMDMQVFDDIDYLLRYITALHGIIGDMSKVEKAGGHFEF